jgi:hypothetical protein
VLIDRLRRVRIARRSPVLLVALGASCALLAGCGSGPSQAGAAAIVGSQSVSLSTLQQRVGTALANPMLVQALSLQGRQESDVSRFLVSRAVQHLLLVETARRDGIVVSDEQVDAELAKPGETQSLEGELAFDPQSQRETVRDQLICQALVDKYLDRLSATVDVVSVDTRDQAMDVARQLAAGPAQAEQAIRAAGRNAQGGLQLRASQLAQQDVFVLFGTPAGQVVAAQTAPNAWTVWRVTQRSTDAPPQGPPHPSALLGADSVSMVGRRLTQPVAEEIGVRVNPRYGVWDSTNLGVLAPGQAPSVVLPATLTGSSGTS